MIRRGFLTGCLAAVLFFVTYDFSLAQDEISSTRANENYQRELSERIDTAKRAYQGYLEKYESLKAKMESEESAVRATISEVTGESVDIEEIHERILKSVATEIKKIEVDEENPVDSLEVHVVGQRIAEFIESIPMAESWEYRHTKWHDDLGLSSRHESFVASFWDVSEEWTEGMLWWKESKEKTILNCSVVIFPDKSKVTVQTGLEYRYGIRPGSVSTGTTFESSIDLNTGEITHYLVDEDYWRGKEDPALLTVYTTGPQSLLEHAQANNASLNLQYHLAKNPRVTLTVKKDIIDGITRVPGVNYGEEWTGGYYSYFRNGRLTYSISQSFDDYGVPICRLTGPANSVDTDSSANKVTFASTGEQFEMRFSKNPFRFVSVASYGYEGSSKEIYSGEERAILLRDEADVFELNCQAYNVPKPVTLDDFQRALVNFAVIAIHDAG